MISTSARGSSKAPLFLLNHWITPASEQAAATVNGTDVLGDRIDTCARLRRQAVNLVAVDFYESGDVLSVAQGLNE